MTINSVIRTPLIENSGMWFGPEGGYWSNIKRSDNTEYLKDIEGLGSVGTVRKYFKGHEDVIFSPKRAGGLAGLDISDNDLVLDAGCMWGAITVPLARTGATVVGMDQTEESLRLLEKRKREEALSNLHIVCADLRKIELHEGVFDKIIVNGVLEWVPETEHVEVGAFRKNGGIWGNLRALPGRLREREVSPGEVQRDLLLKLNHAMKDDGTLYLAIENRYDFFYFLGMPEQHSGMRFVAFMPRWMQDAMSLIFRGRRFRTWTHSKRGLVRLLKSAGFEECDVYYGFPDYLNPELVISDKGMEHYRYVRSAGKKPLWKKAILRAIEHVVFKNMKMTFLAPSLIVHARKGNVTGRGGRS
ncbi:MAG: class I SAM-dependent methyltransferase [Candidatus Omnitrophica bacterium]|nr:class I SAM-dependent methyltransferase [Candidatus Omnitrophota bacterium]